MKFSCTVSCKCIALRGEDCDEYCSINQLAFMCLVAACEEVSDDCAPLLLGQGVL